MILKQILYIFHILCLCSGSVSITLSFLYYYRRRIFWIKYFLTFLIAFTFILLIFMFRLFFDLTPINYDRIIKGIMTGMFLLALDFLVYFIPYFSTWITNLPWKNPHKTVFTVMTVVFGILAVMYVVLFPYNVYIYSALIVSFVGMLYFCLGVVIKNRKGITDPEVRKVIMAFVILSAAFGPIIIIDSMLPFTTVIPDSVIPGGTFSFPLYYFWINILILVYLVGYFIGIPEPEYGQMNSNKIESYHITDREQEIILLLKQGLTYKEIGEKLFISAHTVNNHVAKIYSKVGAKNRFDLLRSLA